MILDLVLINSDTGEPVYHEALLEDDVLKAPENGALMMHAHAMRAALVKYVPKNRPRKEIQAPQEEVAPTAAPGAHKANFVIEDPNGDLLSGDVNLGY